MTAAIGEPAENFTFLFPADDVPRILNAVLLVCRDLKKRCAIEYEDNITDRVWKWVRRVSPFVRGPLDIERESEVLDSDSEDESPEGRIDLKVTCGRGPDIYFAIEAKRLRVCNRKGRVVPYSNKYVDEGMMRFITGQYAPRMDSSAMLGYVFDGNMSAVRVDVSKDIEKHRGELMLREGPGLRPSAILPDHPVDETFHDRKPNPITLYHLLVPV